VRHEKGSGEDGPKRIVAAYDGPPARPDNALSGQNQTSFQERIERLKTRARPDVMTNDLHVPPVGGGGTDTEEELRARVRDTLNPDAGFTPRSGLMKGPMKLVIAMSLLCGFFLFGPTSQISDMVTDKGSTIQSVKNLLVSPEMAISTSVAPGSTNMVRRIGQSTQAASDP
jgi:hypothetical protein